MYAAAAVNGRSRTILVGTTHQGCSLTTTGPLTEIACVQPREGRGYNSLNLSGLAHGSDAVGPPGARPDSCLLTIGTVARTRNSEPIRLPYTFSIGLSLLTGDTDARNQTQSVGSFLRPIAKRCHWCIWRSQHRDTTSGSDGAHGGFLFKFLFNLPHLCTFQVHPHDGRIRTFPVRARH